MVRVPDERGPDKRGLTAYLILDILLCLVKSDPMCTKSGTLDLHGPSCRGGSGANAAGRTPVRLYLAQ